MVSPHSGSVSRKLLGDLDLVDGGQGLLADLADDVFLGDLLSTGSDLGEPRNRRPTVEP